MRWNADLLSTVDAALASSLEGVPTTVVVTGAPGMGKSSLLNEISARAANFATLRAECLPFATPVAFEAVQQLGVKVDPASGGGALAVPLAAQRMRELLDERLVDGPVLVMIDDLQWADPESVEVLLAVIARAEAERLMFALACRPLEPAQHPAFQRWQSQPGSRRIVLDGLDLAAGVEVLHTIQPTMHASVAELLWRHTEGNPLYLQSLAHEYDEEQLAQMPVLPAPAAFAAAVTNRLGRLSPTAVTLARALAALGAGWNSLPDATAVADLDDVAVAVDELVDARLVVLRPGDAGLQMRLAHGLIRSAVYQDIPLAARRALHRRAASVLTGTAVVFDHRVASALSYDEHLADDLERYSEELRSRLDFGSAARFLRSASQVTPDPVTRERRWLESLVDSAADSDFAVIRGERKALEQARDRRRADLVLGLLATSGDWRPQDGVRFLEPWSGAEHTDLCQYRIEGMLAWARMLSDVDDEQIRIALDRAAALPSPDSWVVRFVMLTWAQLTTRHVPDLLALPVLATLPTDPKQVPIPATGALAWRGTIRTGLGQLGPAIADLTEVTDRIQRGSGGFSSGWYYAVLGRTQWFAGDWARSKLSFQAALELSEERRHPLVVAALPLQAIGEGDLARAANEIAEAHEVLDRVPWREAVDQLVLVEVAAAHAGDESSSGLLARLEPWLPDLLGRAPSKSVMWLVHVALAAVWAGELRTARSLADLVVNKPHAATWTKGIAEWMSGLIAEADGDARAAVNHLAAATAADLSGVPLYRAHVLTDHARLVHLARGSEAAQPALAIAAAIYRTLGRAGLFAQAGSTAEHPDAVRVRAANRPVRT